MYLPDPIERGEDKMEDWYFNNVTGEQFKCCCGKMCDISKGEPISRDPYAIPVCPECIKQL